MLCCSLVLSFILLAFLSCLCLITLYSFQPHSCKILFLFSACSCTGSHFSHTYSFLCVFTPLTPLSFLGCASYCASLHSGSLPYLFNFLYFIWIPGGIFAMLPSGNKDCYASIPLIAFMFLNQHQWWCNQKILPIASEFPSTCASLIFFLSLSRYIQNPIWFYFLKLIFTGKTILSWKYKAKEHCTVSLQCVLC